ELDPVEIDGPKDVITPPGVSVRPPLQNRTNAHIVRHKLPGTGADRTFGKIAGTAAMNDQGRVVAQGRDDTDIRRGQVQLHGKIVDTLDRVVTGAENLT